jgi:putative ABC transport system permease protein
MLLGNTMTGVALSVDRLTSQFYEQRNVLEQRLMLGQSWQQASTGIRSDCMRTGMMPIINSMAAAGIVSLPGMMTGQILGGTPPVEAVKYQILIMLLIAAGTGFGVISAIWLTSRHLFDQRHRLRLDLISGRE